MELIKTQFKDLYILKFPHFIDSRGAFQKVFTHHELEAAGLDIDIREIYYSVNKKGVIRGMHFQFPPHDHVKIVSVSSGRILDVVVDIRKEQPTYGKHFSIELNAENGCALLIPSGMAHGFACLEEGSIVNYAQSSCYAPESDGGISYDSFGFDWPLDDAIISDRDTTFPKFNDFKTPFR